VPDTLTPTTFKAAAAALSDAAAAGRVVRVRGGGTKRSWGLVGDPPAVTILSTGLDHTVEHNVGDLTAMFEAGVPLARAQAELAASGQMIAIDPPLGAAGGEPRATVGGVFATGDCGPLAHRYGTPRDQVLGITVALSDGTVARAGGRVIKNVAGYDLARLFTGSFGTLGMILALNVRLHALPLGTATALGAAADPAVLARAATALTRAPLELEALDVAWRGGRGGLLAQVAGVETTRRSETIARAMREAGLEHVDVTAEDAPLWARQRSGQRSEQRAIVRVSARPSSLEAVLRLADSAGATLVGRAGLGVSYLELEAAAIGSLRAGLPGGAHGVVLDHPAGAEHRTVDVWDAAESPEVVLMRAVKARFDPAAVCNRGVFIGGI
jgi:glycolate oxidase FAD binding subunit